MSERVELLRGLGYGLEVVLLINRDRKESKPMSAIQKYKQEALRLEAENKALREENAKLKTGKSLDCSKDTETTLYETSVAVTKRVCDMAYDQYSKPLMASIIEEALHSAYALGKSGK